MAASTSTTTAIPGIPQWPTDQPAPPAHAFYPIDNPYGGFPGAAYPILFRPFDGLLLNIIHVSIQIFQSMQMTFERIAYSPYELQLFYLRLVETLEYLNQPLISQPVFPVPAGYDPGFW